MHVALKSLWQLELTGQEMTLISKALCGNMKPGETKQAAELARHIAEMRASQSKARCEADVGSYEMLLSIQAAADANSGTSK